MKAGLDAGTSALAPYVPRVVRNWSLEPTQRVRSVDGTLVSIDISGFTALSEQLAAKGREGAEELVSTISNVFSSLIEAAEGHGGDVLKFRGDALLLLFVGERHAARACGAASDMQRTIALVGSAVSSVGPFTLQMSVGVHTGLCHLFVTAAPHRELIVAGPAASRVFELEDLASAREIVISAETAAEVDPSWLTEQRGDAWLLRLLEPGASPVPPPADVEGSDLASYIPIPLRAHLAVASDEAEHRQVTVAFLKLSDTDALIQAEGPEALLARIDALADAAGRACEAYDITWLESDIDTGAVKLYLTAGAPSSSGDDEEGMLRGLRDVLEDCADLPLRAGINRGHVFTGDIGAASRRTYAVMGDTVNLAARLCGKAEAGELLTTAAVLDRARTLYETTVRTLRVKGKTLEIEAHVVGDAVGTREVDDTLAGTLVGRDEEVEHLSAALAEARSGAQQVIELVGPPGIGKSRLVTELRTLAAEDGFERLEAATDPYSAAEPYSAFRTLLRKAAGIDPDHSRERAGAELEVLVTAQLPDLARWLPLLAIPMDADAEATPEVSSLDAETSRTRIHEVVESFLDRLLTNPTLIVVEDAHWLDDASEYLLRHLVDRPGARPWLLIVTTRPGVDPFANAEAAHARKIELSPLPDGVAARLTIDIAAEFALSQDDVDKLVSRAGGNPLFMRELVSAARSGQRVETLPDTVESLLTTRIDTLDPPDRLLLRYASVVGPSFDLSLLGEVIAAEVPGAGDRSRWHALEEFVVPTGTGSLAFRHDLIRATAYEGLSFGRRRDIHGRVGTTLESRLGARADDEAALLSLHFYEAGDHSRAWRYAVTAGRRAEAGFANVVAAELYERALSAADRLSDLRLQEVQAVTESLGDVCERFAAYDRALAAYERARRTADDPIPETRIMGKVAYVLDREGRYDDAVEALESALTRLEVSGVAKEGDENRATIQLGLASVSYRQARYDACIEHAEKAIAFAESAADLRSEARASYIAAAAFTDLGRGDGVSYLERALEIYERLNDFRGIGAALNNLGIQMYSEGRWDEALDYYRRSREAKRRVGDALGAAVQSNNEAEILSDQGKLAEAEPLFQDLVRLSRASKFRVGLALGLSNLGRLWARGGRFEEADTSFAEALTLFEALEARRYVTETNARIAECLVFAGRFDEALGLALAQREEARSSPIGGMEAMIERTVGYALWQAQRRAEALPHFEESLRISRELQAPFESALTLLAMAEVGHDAANELRTQANEILTRLGVVSVPGVPLP